MYTARLSPPAPMVTSAAAIRLRPTRRSAGRQRCRSSPASRSSGAPRLPAQPDETPDADGQGNQAEEPHRGRRELEEHRRRPGGHGDEECEAEHLARGDAVGPLERRARHHGHRHQAVVDVGPDERRHGDTEVGPGAGRRQRGRQPAGSGIAGP